MLCTEYLWERVRDTVCLWGSIEHCHLQPILLAPYTLFVQMAHSTGSKRRGIHQKNLPPSLTMPHQLKLRSPAMCCWHCSANPIGIKRISQMPQGLCSGSSGSRIPMEVSLPPRYQNSLPLPNHPRNWGRFRVPVGLWLPSLISPLYLLPQTQRPNLSHRQTKIISPFSS